TGSSCSPRNRPSSTSSRSPSGETENRDEPPEAGPEQGDLQALLAGASVPGRAACLWTRRAECGKCTPRGVSPNPFTPEFLCLVLLRFAARARPGIRQDVRSRQALDA